MNRADPPRISRCLNYPLRFGIYTFFRIFESEDFRRKKSDEKRGSLLLTRLEYFSTDGYQA